MRKTLIAMAVLGAAAGVAHAQSNVTIYGVVDTGYIKKSGFDTQMGENANNRLGFRGVEDLGGGWKATFELERRFDLFDGTQKGQTYQDRKDREFEGAANVGLKSDKWGAIRLGRVAELTTETIRKFDPFDQGGVAAMIYGTQRSEGIDNTIRYDSPNWNGFKFGASYSLGQNTDDDSADPTSYIMLAKRFGVGYDNDGYGLMLGYDNGPLSLVGNYSVLADSNKSSVWNLGAAYRFGDAKVELLYQQTKDKAFGSGVDENFDLVAYSLADMRNVMNMSFNKFFEYMGPNGEYGRGGGLTDLTEKQWLLGLEWKLGPGRLNASAQWMEVEFHGLDASDADIYKYGIGYTYDLSKRTSLYGMLAYTDYEDEVVARMFGDVKDSTTAVQVGITHRF